MSEDLQILAQRANFGMDVEFLIHTEKSHATNLVMETDPSKCGYVPSPTFRLKPPQVQLLMDQLWTAGFRPSEGTGSAGALAATQKHLSDVRKIVAAKLKVDL